MKRWTCPKCGVGKLAPARLTRLDVRRWCLVCSSKSPTLVERVMPARETAKAARAQRRAESRAAATARETAIAQRAELVRAELAAARARPRQRAAEWLRAQVARALALTTWAAEKPAGVAWPPEITIRQGGPFREYASGHAWPRQRRIVVTTGDSAGDDLATLVHELAHIAAPPVRVGRRWESHGTRFRIVEAAAISELVGQQVQPQRITSGRSHSAAVAAWLAKPIE